VSLRSHLFAIAFATLAVMLSCVPVSMRTTPFRNSVLLTPQGVRAQDCPMRPSRPPEELDQVGIHGPNPTRRAAGDYAVSVSPDGGTDQAAGNTGGHTYDFLVVNTGDCPDGYGIVVQKGGSVTSATADPASVSLGPGESATVTVTYAVGDPGTGWITVTALGSFASTDQGSLDVTVVPPPGAPVIDDSPYNFDTQDYSRCAVSCFAAMYAQSTVPYFSLDAPRNVTLIYNGDRVSPKPFVHVNVSPDPSYGQRPTQYQLQVKVNGASVTFLNGEQTLKFDTTSAAPIRIGGQFDASGDTTGMYDLQILVSALYPAPTGLITNAVTTKLLVVNARAKPIARGWNIGGIQRLYQDGDSALIVDGDGSAAYFQRAWDLSYITPLGEFSRLVTGIPGGGAGWTRLYPDSTKVVFNSTGRMIEVRDRFNNITSITYDGSNRVWKITDPQSLTITLTYDANGLDAITDPMGRVTQVTVNADTALWVIQDPDLVSTNFGYDGSKRLSSITDRRGFTTTLGYDANSGKLLTTTSPSVTFVAASGADSTGSPVSTQVAWQKAGVPYVATSGTAFPAPSADTIYARLTDPAGHLSRFTVNHWGARAIAIDPLGRSDSTWFDGNGMPVRVKHPGGGVDSALYNSSGLPTWIRKSGFPATNIRYAGWAQADSVWIDGDSSGVRRSIGANGRAEWVRLAGGTSDSAVTRYHYDTRGRPDSVLDAMNHLVQRSLYSGTNGNRSQDSTTTYGYDTYGRLISTSRPGFATTTTYYSIINRVDSLRDGVNPVATRFGYDNLFLTSVTDPKGQVYGFTNNALGWLTQRTDPTGHSDLYKYSRDGLWRRWINRRGQVITFAYDAAHRPTQKSGDNTTTETWSYPNDTVVVATNPISQDTAILNRHGQPIRLSTVMVGQVYTRRYVYTPVGWLDSVIPSAAGIAFRNRKYLWNNRTGVLKTILLGTDTTQITSNRDGLPTSLSLPGGNTIDNSITAGHAEGAVTIGGPAWGETLTRYLNYIVPGKIREQILGSGQEGRQYTYDLLGRLVGDFAVTWQGPPPPCAGQRYPEMDDNGSVCVADESGGGQWVVGAGATFSYDSAGNRRDRGGQYGAGNRIQQFDGCIYQTDFDGNVTQRACGSDTVNFTWSAESRLIGMTTAGKTLAFYYNNESQLIRKDVNGSPRSHFVWDHGNVLAELDGAGTAKRLEYSYTDTDIPHAVVSGNATFYAHRDGFGNVIGLTDSSVTIQSLFDYDAWGQNLGDSGDTLNRVRFKGSLWLGTEQDIYFMRTRWYEPKTGRFLSEDPIGLLGGINPYAYALDDPLNNSDPLGLDIGDDCSHGGVVVEEDGFASVNSQTGTMYTCQRSDGSTYQEFAPDCYCTYGDMEMMDPVEVTPPDDRDFWQEAGDFAAGWGDLPLGITDLLREAIPLGCRADCVRYDSPQYLAGTVASVLTQAPLAEVVALKSMSGASVFARSTGAWNKGWIRMGWGWHNGDVFRIVIGGYGQPGWWPLTRADRIHIPLFR